jgi:nitrilase
LLRARAVENLCYLLGPAQGGTHANGRETYGDSMIVDPWGHVLARVSEPGPGLAVAEIDHTVQQELRTQFPALSHRRFAIGSAA